ncbi:MAG: MltA domain-containing protein [Deltaproteobacteria bacterium]
MIRQRIQIVSVCLFVVLLVACLTSPEKKVSPSRVEFPTSQETLTSTHAISNEIKPVDWNTVGGFFDDDMDSESLSTAIDKSIDFYRKSKKRKFIFANKEYLAIEVASSLKELRNILASEMSRDDKMIVIKKNFDVYRSDGIDGMGTMVITAYFEPMLNGSLKQTDRYKYPVYLHPQKLTKQNSPSRREIDIDGVLLGKGLEILWVDDPVTLFSMHIQGSGKVCLTDGSVAQLSFAGTNGKPFRSIAEYMFRQGLLPNRSAKSVIDYLTKNPNKDEVLNILSHNERYTFFHISKKPVIGAIGVPIIAGRTIAVDLSVFPPGSIGFMKTALPKFDASGNYNGTKNISRFVLCQDAGIAIKGAGRVDLFFGNSADASMMANAMKSKGQLFIIVKKK